MGTIQKDVEQINYELTGTDIIAKLILNSKGIKKRDFSFRSVLQKRKICRGKKQAE
jgi:DNA polymerase-3 subunit epsilon